MSHSTQPGRWNGPWYRADVAKLIAVSRAPADTSVILERSCRTYSSPSRLWTLDGSWPYEVDEPGPDNLLQVARELVPAATCHPLCPLARRARGPVDLTEIPAASAWCLP